MSNYLIQGQTLTDIADAIRSKTGSSSPISGADMATEIENIPTGGGSGFITAGNAYYFNESEYRSAKQTVDCYAEIGDTIIFVISHKATLTYPSGVSEIATCQYNSNGIKLTFAKFNVVNDGMQRFKFTQSESGDFFITYARFKGLSTATYTGNFATQVGDYVGNFTVPDKTQGQILLWGCTEYAWGDGNPSQWTTTPNDIIYLGWETNGVIQSLELRPRCCAFYDDGSGAVSRSFTRCVGSVAPVVDAIILTFA